MENTEKSMLAAEALKNALEHINYMFDEEDNGDLSLYHAYCYAKSILREARSKVINIGLSYYFVTPTERLFYQSTEEAILEKNKYENSLY
jgi:hypothetical protein